MLDKWFEDEARPRLRGTCQLVRFADDFVVAFEDCHSGKRLLDVLGKRLGRYGLTLHEVKTRYVDFRRKRPYRRYRMASATTFDFLGFTHVWGRSLRGVGFLIIAAPDSRIDSRRAGGTVLHCAGFFGWRSLLFPSRVSP